MEYDVNVLIEALEDIKQIIGPPCSANTCEGCRFEMEEVYMIASNVLEGKSSIAHWGHPQPPSKKES